MNTIFFHREFLTGFHKRKLERQKKAREVAIERERVDRLQARAEAREERRRLADSNMAQMAALLRRLYLASIPTRSAKCVLIYIDL